MSFMKEVLEKNIPIWDKCMATPFVQEMKEGTLPFECFKDYMIQDSIYLKHYARVYGKEIYHAKSLREIQLYYSVLSFVTDTESAVRLKYLEQFGMTDDDIESIAPLPENQRYIDFLLETAEQGDDKEMLMAVLPCMMSYSYIFRKLAKDPARLSCEKDDTDMLAAVREGIKAGYAEFHIYGGTGGRIDHTLANPQVLADLAGNGMQGFLHCPQNELLRPIDKKLKNLGYNKMTEYTPKLEIVITAITDGELSFFPIPNGYISVFSYSEKAEGVYLQGLKYPLEDAALTNTFPIGTSNEFIGKKSRIAVKSGTLMVVFPKEAKEKIVC